MTRRITQAFFGYDQPDVSVTLPEDHEHAGEHTGSLRAWAVDDETGDWWGMCNYSVSASEQYIGWVHQDNLRPVVELTDDDGLVSRVAPDVL
jgi:hypothetical protein